MRKRDEQLTVQRRNETFTMEILIIYYEQYFKMLQI